MRKIIITIIIATLNCSILLESNKDNISKNVFLNGFEIVDYKYKEMNININYPNLTGMNSSENQNNINELLKHEALYELNNWSNENENSKNDLTIILDYDIL